MSSASLATPIQRETWAMHLFATTYRELVKQNKVKEFAQIIFETIGLNSYELIPPFTAEMTFVTKDFTDAVNDEFKRMTTLFAFKLYHKIGNGKYKDKEVIDGNQRKSWIDPVAFYADEVKALFKQHPFPLQVINIYYLKGALSDFQSRFASENMKEWLNEESRMIAFLFKFLDRTKEHVKESKISGDVLTITWNNASSHKSQYSLQQLKQFILSKGALCCEENAYVGRSEFDVDNQTKKSGESREIHFISWQTLVMNWALDTSYNNYKRVEKLFELLSFTLPEPNNITQLEPTFHTFLVDNSYRALLITLNVKKLPKCLEKLIRECFQRENYEYARKMILIGQTSLFKTSDEWKEIISSCPELQYLDRYLQLLELVHHDEDLACQLYDHLFTQPEVDAFRKALKEMPLQTSSQGHPAFEFLKTVNKIFSFSLQEETSDLVKLKEISTIEHLLEVKNLIESNAEWAEELFHHFIPEIGWNASLAAIRDTLLESLPIDKSLKEGIEKLNQHLVSLEIFQQGKLSLIKTVNDFLDFDEAFSSDENLPKTLRELGIDFIALSTAFQNTPLSETLHEGVKFIDIQLMQKIRAIRTLAENVEQFQSYQDYIKVRDYLEREKGIKEIFFHVLDPKKAISLEWEQLEIFFQLESISVLKQVVKDSNQLFSLLRYKRSTNFLIESIQPQENKGTSSELSLNALLFQMAKIQNRKEFIEIVKKFLYDYRFNRKNGEPAGEEHLPSSNMREVELAVLALVNDADKLLPCRFIEQCDFLESQFLQLLKEEIIPLSLNIWIEFLLDPRSKELRSVMIRLKQINEKYPYLKNKVMSSPQDNEEMSYFYSLLTNYLWGTLSAPHIQTLMFIYAYSKQKGKTVFVGCESIAGMDDTREDKPFSTPRSPYSARARLISFGDKFTLDEEEEEKKTGFYESTNMNVPSGYASRRSIIDRGSASSSPNSRSAFTSPLFSPRTLTSADEFFIPAEFGGESKTLQQIDFLTYMLSSPVKDDSNKRELNGYLDQLFAIGATFDLSAVQIGHLIFVYLPLMPKIDKVDRAKKMELQKQLKEGRRLLEETATSLSSFVQIINHAIPSELAMSWLSYAPRTEETAEILKKIQNDFSFIDTMNSDSSESELQNLPPQVADAYRLRIELYLSFLPTFKGSEKPSKLANRFSDFAIQMQEFCQYILSAKIPKTIHFLATAQRTFTLIHESSAKGIAFFTSLESISSSSSLLTLSVINLTQHQACNTQLVVEGIKEADLSDLMTDLSEERREKQIKEFPLSKQWEELSDKEKDKLKGLFFGSTSHVERQVKTYSVKIRSLYETIYHMYQLSLNWLSHNQIKKQNQKLPFHAFRYLYFSLEEKGIYSPSALELNSVFPASIGEIIPKIVSVVQNEASHVVKRYNFGKTACTDQYLFDHLLLEFQPGSLNTVTLSMGGISQEVHYHHLIEQENLADKLRWQLLMLISKMMNSTGRIPIAKDESIVFHDPKTLAKAKRRMSLGETIK